MYEQIKYLVWEGGGNSKEMVAFCGPEPECKLCHGTGEYDTYYGLGCGRCNSRFFAFIDFEGKMEFADDQDVIEKREDGLHLLGGHVE